MRILVLLVLAATTVTLAIATPVPSGHAITADPANEGICGSRRLECDEQCRTEVCAAPADDDDDDDGVDRCRRCHDACSLNEGYCTLLSDLVPPPPSEPVEAVTTSSPDADETVSPTEAEPEVIVLAKRAGAEVEPKRADVESETNRATDEVKAEMCARRKRCKSACDDSSCAGNGASGCAMCHGLCEMWYHVGRGQCRRVGHN